MPDVFFLPGQGGIFLRACPPPFSGRFCGGKPDRLGGALAARLLFCADRPCCARSAFAVPSGLYAYIQQVSGCQGFGIFQQQQPLPGAGVARASRQAGHGKGCGNHPRRFPGHRAVPLPCGIFFRPVVRVRWAAQEQGCKAQGIFFQARVRGEFFQPWRRARAAEGKVAPCAAVRVFQKRAAFAMRAGGEDVPARLQGQTSHVHDGCSAQPCARFHKKQSWCLRFSALREGRERCQKAGQFFLPATVGDFPFFRLLPVCAALAGAQFVEHVDGAHQPGTCAGESGQAGCHTCRLFQRGAGCVHLPYGMSAHLAQSFQQAFAQFQRLGCKIHGQHADGSGAPSGVSQPEGQGQSQWPGSHIQQKGFVASSCGLACALPPGVGRNAGRIGQGQGGQQARETQEVPGQKVVKIGADSRRRRPVGTCQPRPLGGQQAGEAGNVFRQGAPVRRAERSDVVEGFGQAVQQFCGLAGQGREQGDWLRPALPPFVYFCHAGARFLRGLPYAVRAFGVVRLVWQHSQVPKRMQRR